MQRLIYLSSAAGRPTNANLGMILAAARRNNMRDGITGLLLYHDGNFLQILEGEAEKVQATFARIAANPRHRNLQRLPPVSVHTRLFPDWSMGFARPETVIVDSSIHVTAFREIQRDIKRIQTQDRRAAAMMRVFFASFRDILPTVQV